VLAPGNFNRRVVGRMLDFFAVYAPWQRRLWNVGMLLALKEIAEGSDAVRDRALSQASLDWFRESLRARIGQDPGVGDKQQLKAVQAALHTRIAADGESHRVLRQVGADIKGNYLRRWHDALAMDNHGHQPERVARAFASHLLDAGISQDHLHRWLTFLRDHDATEHDVGSIAVAGEALLARDRKRFRVLVLFETPFPSTVTPPPEWLTRPAAQQWLVDLGLDRLLGDVEHRGGLLLRVRSSDPEAAVEAAGEIVDAVVARVAVGARTEMRPHPACVVRGQTQRRYELRRRRRVDVRSLARQERLTHNLDAINKGPVDSALQLLSHLDASSPETAVAGGWSAIESLLTAPGDEQGNVAVADRMAALVACAWPRAELTTLAWRRIEAIDDSFSRRLETVDTNEERARLVASEIQAGNWLQLTPAGDETAERRMAKLLANPSTVLRDVEAHAAVAFRRLYRQRNLVVHGGRTGAVALRASLRTASPLVGAGMDRIVHAHLVTETHPLDLTARASLELARAGSRDGRDLTALLETSAVE